ncbi:MAG: hypothetical protein U9P79_03490, partial [Candidatus Cloacimonadota bacterium]|nr:hypothetical protein [Candidatus Cloacimonadota bacterium]
STEDYIISMQSDTVYFSASNDIETSNVGDELKVDGQTEIFEEEIGDQLKIDSRNEQTTIAVGDELEIDAQEQEFERSMDRIEVGGTGDAYAEVHVLDFANEALGGGVGPVVGEVIPPLYNFPPFYQDFSVFENENIEYVIIDTGTVYITFQNNTEIPLSSTHPNQNDQMHFEFWTNGTAASHPDSIFMFTHYIDHVIEPGAIEYISIPFDGQTVYMDNYMVCYLTTDGSSGPVNVDEDDTFGVTFSVGNMSVSEANAIIENASVNHEDAISISDESIQVISATIDSCIGNIYIDSNLPVNIDTLIIEFSELFNPPPDNTPFKIKIEEPIISGSNLNIPIDLAGCVIQSLGTDPLDSLDFSLYASSDPPPTYVLVTQEDQILTNIEFGRMKFETIHGIIDQESNNDGEIELDDDIIELQSAQIKEGNINIELTGIDLETPSRVEILFDEIETPAGEPLLLVIDNNFNNFQFDFADHWIEFVPPLQTLHYHTTVILDQEIEISNTDIVTADITLSNLIFEEITGKFGSFTIEDEDATVIDSTGEFSLHFAKIDSCDVLIQIKEEDYSLPFGADIEIVFEEIFDSNGDTLIINLRCPSDTLISFANHTIGNDQAATLAIDSLHYSYTVITDSTNNYVTVYYEDEVKATIGIGDMIFDEVKGIINEKRFDVDDIDEAIDIGNIPDSLNGVMNFQNAELHLDVYNGTGFDCWLYINLVGKNDAGDSAVIVIDNNTGVLVPNATSTLCVSAGVSELLNLIPTEIVARNPYAIVGDGITVGNITKEDSIAGSYTLETPFTFIINDHTVTMDTLQHIEIDDETQDKIQNNLNNVKVKLNTENKFPFGFTARLYFASDSSKVWTEPELIIDSLIIEPAVIDTTNGVSGDPTPGVLFIELNNAEGDLNVFTNPDVYVGTEFDIIGTNGNIVTCMGSDNLNLIGILSVKVHIDESLWEE